MHWLCCLVALNTNLSGCGLRGHAVFCSETFPSSFLFSSLPLFFFVFSTNLLPHSSSDDFVVTLQLGAFHAKHLSLSNKTASHKTRVAGEQAQSVK